MSNEHPSTGGEGAAPGGESAGSGQATSKTDLDALFEALADAQRRRILAYLETTDDDVAAYSDLIEHVADDPAGESTDDQRVAVNLHHNHLPKLADAGLLEYDARSETVRYRGGPAVSEWLDLVRTYDPDVTEA